MSDPLTLLHGELTRLVAEHPGNRGEEGAPYFDAPLVGVADAFNPLFTRYKNLIGPFHWSPAEAFGLVHGEGSLKEGSVVSWVLPIAKATRRANKAETEYPARSWAHTRHHGEHFNEELRRLLVAALETMGARAVAPAILPEWKRIDDPEIGLASTWSERHAAFAAGLGTFSLSDGFITEKGIAHRLGSVVTDLVLPPSPRIEGDHRANCLYYPDTKCGVCIERCPAGAITEKGHDKAKCSEYSYGVVGKKVNKVYGVDISGCGLCQTGVPCEGRIPRR